MTIEFEDLLALMNRLGLVCGEPRPVADRGPRRAEEIGQVSRSARKRREFAKTQNLYYKDKAAALKYITNRAKFVDYVAPTREISQDWENYFYKQQLAQSSGRRNRSASPKSRKISKS